jgi:hypothetical protein
MGNKNSNHVIVTANISLEHLVELYLNWNHNSDIINIICDYIHLKPVDKIKYFNDNVPISVSIGPRHLPGIYICDHCHQVCNNDYKHDLECTGMTNCHNCNYQGLSNSEYLEHKQNNCSATLINCQHCGIQKFRMDMNRHHIVCDKLFQCGKCTSFYTKDNMSLHQLFCEFI